MRRLLFIFSFISLAILSSSAAIDNTMYVCLTNDSTIKFKLNVMPLVILNEDSLIFKTDEFEVALSYSKSEVRKITFVDPSLPIPEPPIPSSIQSLDKGGKTELQFTYVNRETILLEGLSDDSSVKVYDLTGMEMPVDISFSNGSALISISNLKNQVYIIKTRHRSIKIFKK